MGWGQFCISSSVLKNLALFKNNAEKWNKIKHMGSAFVFTYNPPISVIPSRLFQKTKIWQVASGSFKRVYLPEIFSNVSKKNLLFQETSSF